MIRLTGRVRRTVSEARAESLKQQCHGNGTIKEAEGDGNTRSHRMKEIQSILVIFFFGRGEGRQCKTSQDKRVLDLLVRFTGGSRIPSRPTAEPRNGLNDNAIRCLVGGRGSKPQPKIDIVGNRKINRDVSEAAIACYRRFGQGVCSIILPSKFQHEVDSPVVFSACSFVDQPLTV